MSTVTLVCGYCGEQFEKSTVDYNRRLAKLPGNNNFFCNLSHSASHRNARLHAEGKLKRGNPQPNNEHRRKYPIEYTWYIHRITTDPRKKRQLNIILTEEERLNFVRVLDAQWEQQQGRCVFTGVPLERRKGSRGVTETTNPFKIASLDRIDCNQGYNANNIQWTSVAINLARGNLPVAEFAESLKVIIGGQPGNC